MFSVIEVCNYNKHKNEIFRKNKSFEIISDDM